MESSKHHSRAAMCKKPPGTNITICACGTACVLSMGEGFIMRLEISEQYVFMMEANCAVVDVRYPQNYSVDRWIQNINTSNYK